MWGRQRLGAVGYAMKKTMAAAEAGLPKDRQWRGQIGYGCAHGSAQKPNRRAAKLTNPLF
jgi:hypothetical protein